MNNSVLNEGNIILKNGKVVILNEADIQEICNYYGFPEGSENLFIELPNNRPQVRSQVKYLDIEPIELDIFIIEFILKFAPLRTSNSLKTVIYKNSRLSFEIRKSSFEDVYFDPNDFPKKINFLHELQNSIIIFFNLLNQKIPAEFRLDCNLEKLENYLKEKKESLKYKSSEQDDYGYTAAQAREDAIKAFDGDTSHPYFD